MTSEAELLEGVPLGLDTLIPDEGASDESAFPAAVPTSPSTRENQHARATVGETPTGDALAKAYPVSQGGGPITTPAKKSRRITRGAPVVRSEEKAPSNDKRKFSHNDKGHYNESNRSFDSSTKSHAGDNIKSTPSYHGRKSDDRKSDDDKGSKRRRSEERADNDSTSTESTSKKPRRTESDDRDSSGTRHERGRISPRKPTTGHDDDNSSEKKYITHGPRVSVEPRSSSRSDDYVHDRDRKRDDIREEASRRRENSSTRQDYRREDPRATYSQSKKHETEGDKTSTVGVNDGSKTMISSTTATMPSKGETRSAGGDVGYGSEMRLSIPVNILYDPSDPGRKKREMTSFMRTQVIRKLDAFTESQLCSTMSPLSVVGLTIESLSGDKHDKAMICHPISISLFDHEDSKVATSTPVNFAFLIKTIHDLVHSYRVTLSRVQGLFKEWKDHTEKKALKNLGAPDYCCVASILSWTENTDLRFAADAFSKAFVSLVTELDKPKPTSIISSSQSSAWDVDRFTWTNFHGYFDAQSATEHWWSPVIWSPITSPSRLKSILGPIASLLSTNKVGVSTVLRNHIVNHCQTTFDFQLSHAIGLMNYIERAIFCGQTSIDRLANVIESLTGLMIIECDQARRKIGSIDQDDKRYKLAHQLAKKTCDLLQILKREVIHDHDSCPEVIVSCAIGHVIPEFTSVDFLDDDEANSSSSDSDDDERVGSSHYPTTGNVNVSMGGSTGGSITSRIATKNVTRERSELSKGPKAAKGPIVTIDNKRPCSGGGLVRRSLLGFDNDDSSSDKKEERVNDGDGGFHKNADGHKIRVTPTGKHIRLHSSSTTETHSGQKYSPEDTGYVDTETWNKLPYVERQRIREARKKIPSKKPVVVKWKSATAKDGDDDDGETGQPSSCHEVMDPHLLEARALSAIIDAESRSFIKIGSGIPPSNDHSDGPNHSEGPTDTKEEEIETADVENR